MDVPRGLEKLVSEQTLDAIAGTVDEAESRTSAEIVVHLVKRLLPLESPRARALRVFFELGVDHTKGRNGVLLFVVLKKRSFEIVTDVEVDRVVDREVWEEIAEHISERMGREGLEQGLQEGIRRIGAVLARHFPREPQDMDELPDRPDAPR